jgi:hypothetical protein
MDTKEHEFQTDRGAWRGWFRSVPDHSSARRAMLCPPHASSAVRRKWHPAFSTQLSNNQLITKMAVAPGRTPSHQKKGDQGLPCRRLALQYGPKTGGNPAQSNQIKVNQGRKRVSRVRWQVASVDLILTKRSHPAKCKEMDLGRLQPRHLGSYTLLPVQIGVLQINDLRTLSQCVAVKKSRASIARRGGDAEGRSGPDLINQSWTLMSRAAENLKRLKPVKTHCTIG